MSWFSTATGLSTWMLNCHHGERGRIQTGKGMVNRRREPIGTRPDHIHLLFGFWFFSVKCRGFFYAHLIGDLLQVLFGRGDQLLLQRSFELDVGMRFSDGGFNRDQVAVEFRLVRITAWNGSKAGGAGRRAGREG